MKKHLIILLILLVMLPNQVLGATGTKVLNLTVDPQKVLFDIRNVKPGDSFPRKIAVMNKGNNGFKYIVTNKFITGSKEFYDRLILKIEDGTKVVYEGNLKDFEKLDPRLLKSKSKEDLYFYITVPYELDNKYQGLNCEFQLKFYVEGTLGGALPADGPRLPATGTNMFNFLVAGITLVLAGGTLQFIKSRRKQDKPI
ncbi:LPXTG cell wall anchor domain-containing protein [Neobacillus rhizophilus]|uniref:LPXTG cell wall anchor domain-containing protein n=1 Tax=Neobacillus rhizophilus TaxID=2833579 RepID=A0A942YZC2_9BACI|nr:LPXTG cell wall anchor domain-containing protein [Neobacillus rhizophilus]MBS4215971.1 LPXTG cell wall anchor domain-containing protein [Neobacillus rhizophilus]MBU8916132.1 LPXTG cell wall anchor domain-containing protein [Bacillus sp. FJAT-29953]